MKTHTIVRIDESGYIRYKDGYIIHDSRLDITGNFKTYKTVKEARKHIRKDGDEVVISFQGLGEITDMYFTPEQEEQGFHSRLAIWQSCYGKIRPRRYQNG